MFYLLKNNDGGGYNNVGYTEKKTVTNGKLGAVLTAAGAIASGDTVAAYVCMQDKASGSAVCTAITEGMVFEVDAPEGIAVDKSYRFATNGLGITSTEASTGGAKVLAIEGAKCRVKINI